MQPQSPYPTQPTNVVYPSNGPATSPEPPNDAPASFQPSGPSGKPAPKSTKLPLILFAIAVLELLIILGLLFALAHKAKTTTPTTNQYAAASTGAPQPATATSLQQTNDSISQDLSGLSNDRDFPATKLSDSALGL